MIRTKSKGDISISPNVTMNKAINKFIKAKNQLSQSNNNAKI